MSAESLVARLFSRVPSLGALVGLAMVLGFGALGVSSARDYRQFPQQPRQSTVAEAVAHAGDSNWVTLTDALWQCEREIAAGSGAGASHNDYIPALDPSGKYELLLSFDSPVVCAAAAKSPVTGVLTPLNSRLRATLTDQGAQLTERPLYLLSTYSGPDNSLLGVYISVPLMLLGLLVIWFYGWRMRRPATALPPGRETVAPLIPEQPVFSHTGAPLDALTAWRKQGPVLPPRPYALQPAMVRSTWIKAAILIPLGIALCALVAVWQGREVQQFLGERALWKTGTPAPEVEVKGKTSGKLFLTTADMEVVFTDVEGKQHRVPQSVSYAFASLDDKAPLEVHYDPQNPSRVAVSWMLALAIPRMINVALYVGIFGLMAALPLIIAFGLLSKLSSSRRAASDSDEVVVRVVKIVPQQTNGAPNGNLEYHLAPGDAAEERTPWVMVRPQHEPALLWVDDDHLLALRCQRSAGKQDDELVLLDESLHPYVFGAEDSARIQSRLQTLRQVTGRAAG